MKRAPLDPVDEERTYVLAPDGQRRLVGLRQDVPETLPTGERRYVRYTTLISAADGALIDPERPELVRCHCCNASPLTTQATRTCAACDATICRDCTTRVGETADAYCRPCARQLRRRALRQFFCSFQ